MMNFNHTELFDNFNFLIRQVNGDRDINIFIYIERVYFAVCVNFISSVFITFVTDL